MKITVKAIAVSTVALTLAVSAMLATPASAKTRHHSARHMRHHRMSGTGRMSGRRSGSMGRMHRGGTGSGSMGSGGMGGSTDSGTGAGGTGAGGAGGTGAGAGGAGGTGAGGTGAGGAGGTTP